jgi:SAM-dependent methyltransferase
MANTAMKPAPDEQSIRASLQAGMAHHDAGRLDEAAAVYRKVLEASPGRPEALVLLAGIAHGAGRPAEAADLLTRAIATNPSVAAYHHRLGLALEDLGRFDDALLAHANGIALGDAPGARAGFGRSFAFARRMPRDSRLLALVVHAIAEAWIRPADLAGSAIGLVRASPTVHDAIEAAQRGELAPSAVDALLGRREVCDALSHPLMLAILENTQVPDWGLERFLAATRESLLRAALVGADRPDLAPFACALARQCFLGDYVHSSTQEETARVATLYERLFRAADAGETISGTALAALASYEPLHFFEWPKGFAQRAWPAPVQALLAQQLVEPRAERELAASIPSFGTIEDEVSLRVQRQYEESPYPRWVRLPANPQPTTFEAQVGALFPTIQLPTRGPGGMTEVLVAGCGTGQESMDLAQNLTQARVLAIDLSLASLAYARRKTMESGIGNIEYAQADILSFESPREFDFISSVGVLHHLRDPIAGWRRLVSVLRPGGLMQVGLYSELGRRDLEPARSLIASKGWKANSVGIRRGREAILADPNFARIATLRDMYGLNECRDLLFHAQEHRYRLDQVKSIVDALGLEALGLAVPAPVAQAFFSRFGPASAGDLGAWDTYEKSNPDTFSGMYILWLRKR